MITFKEFIFEGVKIERSDYYGTVGKRHPTDPKWESYIIVDDKGNPLSNMAYRTKAAAEKNAKKFGLGDNRKSGKLTIEKDSDGGMGVNRFTVWILYNNGKIVEQFKTQKDAKIAKEWIESGDWLKDTKHDKTYELGKFDMESVLQKLGKIK